MSLRMTNSKKASEADSVPMQISEGTIGCVVQKKNRNKNANFKIDLPYMAFSCLNQVWLIIIFLDRYRSSSEDGLLSSSRALSQRCGTT